MEDHVRALWIQAAIFIVGLDILSSVSQDLIRPVNSCLRTVTWERELLSMGRDSCNFALAPWWFLRNFGLLKHDECILGPAVLQANGLQVDLQDQALIIGPFKSQQPVQDTIAAE